MTLAEIAAELRKQFPDAVSVEFFVNATEHSFRMSYRDVSGPEHGASYKQLDGQWAHERPAGAQDQGE
jgi:hypothetical protein